VLLKTEREGGSEKYGRRKGKNFLWTILRRFALRTSFIKSVPCQKKRKGEDRGGQPLENERKRVGDKTQEGKLTVQPIVG